MTILNRDGEEVTTVSNEEITVRITFNRDMDTSPCPSSTAVPPPFGIPPPLGHDYEATVTEPTCTEGGFTTHTCTRCGDCFRDGHRDPLGYDWSGTVCRRCGAVRENPFEDVPAGSFYYDPVIWAVANGVTTGATATTFNPGGECMRAQVVTFLYRAFA